MTSVKLELEADDPFLWKGNTTRKWTLKLSRICLYPASSQAGNREVFCAF